MTIRVKRNLLIVAVAVLLGCSMAVVMLMQCRRHGVGALIGLPTVRRAEIVFAGDLMQHTTQVRAAKNAQGILDYSQSFRYVRDILSAADVAIVNLETTLAPRPPYTGYPRFRSPRELAGAMKDVGFDIAALANNHICDNGRTGIEFTVSCLDSCGIATTGAFADSSRFADNHPLRFETDGIRFALLNYTYGTNGLPIPNETIVNLIDTARIAADLAGINRNRTDCVIVFFHWGEEGMRKPTSEQRAIDTFCRERGADIVIGSHPHVVQPIEYHTDADSVLRAVTVFSLGNFVSNQRWRYSDGGLIVRIRVEKRNDEPVSLATTAIPIWVLMPGYRILPSAVADTMAMPPKQRRMYEQFARDIVAFVR